MNNKPVIFYHASCADGFGAAFAAWRTYRDNAEYVAMQYGTVNTLADTDLLGDIQGRTVYILDFSFPLEIMQYIVQETNHVFWLDHHKTAFEMWTPGVVLTPVSKYEHSDKNITVILDNARSGAMIAWEYFQATVPPQLIRHIDDYDRWVFKDPDTKAYIKALWFAAPWSFEQWNELVNVQTIRDAKPFITIGRTLLEEHNNQVKRATAKSCACLVAFAPGLAINAAPQLSSDTGHELAKQSGTYGLVYHIDHNLRVKCSLRSTGDYDVSAIAKRLGGGGHKNAAGFECSLTDLTNMLSPAV